jgi:hypothetical protein
MPLIHKHSIQEENELVAPGGTPTDSSSNESLTPTGSPAPYEPQTTVLLSQTKNTIETIHREARDETIVNGKYVLDSEDDTYLYCYYQTTYRVKVMKDAAKKGINYRDAQGRLLPGYSLVKATKSEDTVVGAKRKKRFNKKSAERYLEQDLLADLLEEIKTGDLSSKDRASAMLSLVNYVKPVLSKNTQENIVRIVNDEFEDAQVIDDDSPQGDKNEEYD